jgi:ADP-heptose:LPS heptosyltransferase
MFKSTVSNIKIIFLFFLDRIATINSIKNNHKREGILVVRLDEIGDYILFRNYIEILKSDKKYHNYNITLLGNKAWKSLSLDLDIDFVDKFIWLDKKKFNANIVYRYRKIKEITSCSYEIIINSMYSRVFTECDTIVKSVDANKKIGSIGNLSNITRWQKYISDKYYDILIPATDNIIFEFYRNKEFFENLLDTNIDIKKPSIKLKKIKSNALLPEKYAILFIGASSSFRRWGVENYAKIGQYLKNVHNYEIVLCGAYGDMSNAKQFAYYFRDDYLDLVGKTSLIELLYIIEGGGLLVSNETSVPHFAVALKLENIFVIFNGNHYGRFTPYPKEMSKSYHALCHPKIKQNISNYRLISNNAKFNSSICIDDIKPGVVQDAIESALIS